MIDSRIARWRAAPRRLAGLVRTAWPKRRLVAEACLTLALAEARLKLFPLKRQGLQSLVPAPVAGRTGPPEAAPADRRTAIEIGWAVSRVAAYFPESAMCLAQALTARTMLRRRGIESVLHLGVGRSPDSPFEAHAWLESGGVEVTGYPVPAHLREIGRLPGAGSRDD